MKIWICEILISSFHIDRRFYGNNTEVLLGEFPKLLRAIFKFPEYGTFLFMDFFDTQATISRELCCFLIDVYKKVVMGLKAGILRMSPWMCPEKID